MNNSHNDLSVDWTMSICMHRTARCIVPRLLMFESAQCNFFLFSWLHFISTQKLQQIDGSNGVTDQCYHDNCMASWCHDHEVTDPWKKTCPGWNSPTKPHPPPPSPQITTPSHLQPPPTPTLPPTSILIPSLWIWCGQHLSLFNIVFHNPRFHTCSILYLPFWTQMGPSMTRWKGKIDCISIAWCDALCRDALCIFIS